MKVTVAEFFAVLATTGLAALGGGLAVYSAYDDAPGGVLLAVALVAGTTIVGLKIAQGRRVDSQRAGSPTLTCAHSPRAS